MNTEYKKMLHKRNWKENIQEENWHKVGTGLKRRWCLVTRWPTQRGDSWGEAGS